MKYISKAFNWLWRGLDGLRKVLHLILLLTVFLLIVAALSPRSPVVPHKAALVIAPNGALVEQLTGDPLDRAIAEVSGQGRPESSLRDLIDAMERAKTDERIEVLVLDLGGMAGGGVAKLEELAAAVRDFRESGKKVLAYGDGFDQSQYYVAAHADEVYMDPEGLVLIEGFGYYRTFLKGAIDKLAVDVHVFRAGKFKSYTDQFSRTDMSEPEEEESRMWLEALWTQYQNAVTKARGLDAGAIAAYANGLTEAARAQRGNLAQAALENGLVNELKTRREFEQQMIELVGEEESEHTYQGVMYWDYLAATRAADGLHLGGDRVGVIVASGEIVDGDFPPGTIGSESTVRLLRRALHDDAIKSVVLRIDSPGGSTFASEVIRREIRALREAGKPVIASMSSTAASGGYYIAMDADEIWASPATLTGSIGVFAVVPTIERTLQKIGVTVDGIGTTELSGALRLDRTLDENAREILQLAVDHTYRSFVAHVAAARQKSFEEIDALAQGRVWAGVDAHARGLVDQLGLYEQALDAAAQRAGLGEDYEVEYIEAPLGWRQALARQTNVLAARITRALLPDRTALHSARRLFAPLEAEIARLARFTDARKVYYYCACPAY